MIKAIVIEDTHDGMEHMLRLLNNNLPEVEVVGQGRSNSDLLRMIEKEDLDPDVLILDIHVTDGQIFQSLALIDTSNIHLIFTTAYEEYAVQAFQKAAIHYLLKPINKEDLILAFQRIKNVRPRRFSPELQSELTRSMNETSPNAIEKTSVASVKGVHFLRYKDIIRMEGDDTYTTFHMVDGDKIVASKNLGHFMDHYGKHNFVRTHQSHMINVNHIARYTRGDGGNVTLDNGDIVPLARRMRPEFLEKLREIAEQLG
jgi:two-component system, LytTR family, response regulator